MKVPFVILVLLLSACGEEETPPQGPLSIVGTWADDYGLDHAIAEAAWTQTGFGDTSVFDIIEYRNDSHSIFAHNADTNAYNPGLWSRFDWTTFEDELWYCQSVTDGATEDDARDPARRGDPHSPDTEGCSGYAWSRLRVPLSVRGTYDDPWNGVHEITQVLWTQTYPTDVSNFHITTFDNETGVMAAHNDTANAAFSDLWSRLDWFSDGNDLYYCQSKFDATSEAEALAAPAPDRSDPANSGCNGYGWTPLSEQ